MWELLKRGAAHLPYRMQQTYRKLAAQHAVTHPRSLTKEPELDRLADWVQLGDWAIDVGANIGLYTSRLSQIVGPMGRVFALEPAPLTFELLTASVASLPIQNVTLLNAAASDHTGIVHMTTPISASGLPHHYESAITVGGKPVFAIALDTLACDHHIALAKIDAEGHEAAVLRGMLTLLQRDRPVVILEDNGEADALLRAAGYHSTRLTGSSNQVYTPL